MPEFQEWPKIARLNRDIIVTEKLDGTNACVIVEPDGAVHAQSRKRIITPDSDNFGFARWVAEHADELSDGLGPGYHFGEWYGSGIQRTYGLDHKRFALFNSARWGRASAEFVPDCCEVVPELYVGPFSHVAINVQADILRERGSFAVPGYMNPEGIVIWHTAARISFKVTLTGDEKPKNSQ